MFQFLPMPRRRPRESVAASAFNSLPVFSQALFAAAVFTCLSGWGAAADTPSAQQPAAETRRRLRAGAALSNITPPLGISINGYFNDRKARHIHDELHARCLVLDDGKTRIALVICDNCLIPRSVFDNAKRLIQQQTGLDASHVLIAATHTHFAPTVLGAFQSEPDAEYIPFLTKRIADGVIRAVNNLAPARIAWGSGQVPDQVFNRRWKLKPGKVPANPFGSTNDLVKMNPMPGSPDLVEPAGPTDPELAVVSIQTADGKPLALLANYSLHYVGTSQSEDISADYFGAFADRIQQLLGADHEDPPFVALLSNGTSGDINNINFRNPQRPQGPYEQMHAVADAVAREAQRVCQSLTYQDWVPLGVEETELPLEVRRPDAAELARAREILEKAAGRELKTPAEVYAHETVLMEKFQPDLPLIIQTIRIGDLGIAAVPCEVFAEIGLAIKKQSPFKQTFTIELANGSNGYLPTPEQHRLGGYETWRARTTYLEVEAAPKIVDTLMKLFAKLQTGN